MELPKKKLNRLKNYDYNTPAAYFITICTRDRKNLFWSNVGATIGRPFELSEYGSIVESAIKNTPLIYTSVSVDMYVIMPNHIHLILQIHSDENGRGNARPYGIYRNSAIKRICYKANRFSCLAEAFLRPHHKK